METTTEAVKEATTEALATSATSETAGKGGDHGGRGGTKKAKEETTETLATTGHTGHHGDRGTPPRPPVPPVHQCHVRMYVALSNFARLVRPKTSLTARETWTKKDEMSWHYRHENS